MNAKLLAAAQSAAPPVCRLLRATEEGQWTAHLHAVSPHGAELLLDRKVKPAMLLTVVLPLGARLVSVQRVAAQAGGRRWLAACRFARPMNRAEWRAWLEQVQHNAACPVVRATEEGPWAATLRTVSPRGLEVLTSRPFAVDSYLTVELCGAGPVRSRLLHATKIRRDLVAGGWLIGGVLLTQLADEELERLAERTQCAGAN